MRILVYILVLNIFSCRHDIADTALDGGSWSEQQKEGIKKLELAPRDFVTWIKSEKNGFYKTQIQNGLVVSVLYRPTPFMVCVQERKESMSQALYNRKAQDFENMLYFSLQLELPEQGGDLLKYQLPDSASLHQRVQYYSFDVSKDIILLQDEQKIPCVMHHFERTFGISPKLTLMLAFSRKDVDFTKNFVFRFKDVIFDKGVFNLQYSKDVLETYPKLILNG